MRCVGLAGIAIGLVSVLSSAAYATTIFFEDFEGIPDSAFTEDFGHTKPGLPLVSEGAMETWYGGRFEHPSGGTINQDIVVRDRGDVFPAQNKYARFEDNAGLLLNVSTVGLTDVQLSFDWLTHTSKHLDRLKVGYYAGAITFPGPTSDGGVNAAYMRQFDKDGPTWPHWTQLLSDKNHSWESATFALPSNEAELWVAFWIHGAEKHYGKIDDIRITAVPEPAKSLFVALAIAGCLVFRRKLGLAPRP